MNTKPHTAFFVIRDKRTDNVPECRRMIHMNQMAKFMNNYIVQNVWWSHHQPPVKGKRTGGSAASPTGFLIAYGNFFMMNRKLRFIKKHPFGKIFCGCAAVSFLQKFLLGI